MTQVTEAAVMDALKRVKDPDRGQDVVALGMVQGMAIKGGHVHFTLEVEAERGPKLEPLRRAAEKAVEALPGVLSVTAVLTADKPARGGQGHRHGHAHGQGHQHGQGQPNKPLIPGVRTIVAVASGKGGVGKSTTAVNLALALKGKGLKVGILDADIYGPSLPRMMAISGKPETTDGKVLEPKEGYGVKTMSIGYLIAEDTPMIWRGPMVMSAIEQMLRDVNWGELDIMVVDLPPGTGDAQLTMAQRVPLSGAVIVSTPQDIALLDARKGLGMFRKVDVPVLGIVENMSYFLCPHCGERSDIFAHGGARREAARLGTEFLGEIPLDIAIRETSDQGFPIVISKPDHPQAKVYREIADRVWAKLTGEAPANRPAPRIVVS
ncbi:MAG: iron-sulfur cluster carrier protein ApbC [Alphaproteobacteria bacterium]|nr:iron-sulfur cluster carrier protein ApbC [Alphaproteobacteria bacterium]